MSRFQQDLKATIFEDSFDNSNALRLQERFIKAARLLRFPAWQVPEDLAVASPQVTVVPPIQVLTPSWNLLACLSSVSFTCLIDAFKPFTCWINATSLLLRHLSRFQQDLKATILQRQL